jgi:hypothetical protein
MGFITHRKEPLCSISSFLAAFCLPPRVSGDRNVFKENEWLTDFKRVKNAANGFNRPNHVGSNGNRNRASSTGASMRPSSVSVSSISVKTPFIRARWSAGH